jgi:alginate O-acetyltransferase complex protein AlgJ
MLRACLLIFFVLVATQVKADQTFAFTQCCASRISEVRVIRGDAKNWFFPMREIKQLSLGNFWEKPWKEITLNQSNPIPSILEFQNRLAQKNVQLLIVPIPAKATIYPEKFSTRFAPGQAQGLTQFIIQLQAQGLQVLDLEPLFLEKRQIDPDFKFYCAQDAHFSPMGCLLVADLIADRLHKDFQIPHQENPALKRTREQQIQITGDLVAFSEWEKTTTRETLPIQYVSPAAPIDSQLQSPILLLGDSHTLVYSDQESFHCESAGLFDHLSAALGQPIDLEGSASGGLMTSRINLYRKAAANPGYWARKKVVVWVFTAREFTQCSYQAGFISIPIER